MDLIMTKPEPLRCGLTPRHTDRSPSLTAANMVCVRGAFGSLLHYKWPALQPLGQRQARQVVEGGNIRQREKRSRRGVLTGLLG